MNTLIPVLFLPLLGAIVNRLFGARMGKKASAGLACIASVLLAFGFAVASFVGLAHPGRRRHLRDRPGLQLPAQLRQLLDLRYDLLLDPFRLS